MLRCKVKAEIEILHEVEVTDAGSPSAGLPLVRYIADQINSRLLSIANGTLVI
jgi:hypothetical protein